VELEITEKLIEGGPRNSWVGLIERSGGDTLVG